MATKVVDIDGAEMESRIGTTRQIDEVQQTELRQLQLQRTAMDMLVSASESRVVTTDQMDELEQAEITAAADRC